MGWRRWVPAAMLAMTIVPAGAGAADPHAVYERRCARCHEGHAGDFVAKSLIRREGQIVGRDSGTEIGAFLAAGHGRLSAAELPVVVSHLNAIFESGGLFRTHCRICHDPAVNLARRELTLRDGRVVGRYSGRDIRTFMENHGRLEGEEVDTVMRMLERQLKTVE